MAGATLPNGLTLKQEEFCLAFTRLGPGHGNASEAYRIVYKPKKSKPSTIHRTAHSLMTNPKIATRIKELRDDVAACVGLTREKVLNSVRCAIEFDPAKLFNEDGSLKKITELDEDTRSALSVIELAETQLMDDSITVILKKFKAVDKNTARDQAMKHFGLYQKDNEQQQPPELDLTVDDMARAVALMLAEAGRKGKKKQPA